MAVLPELLFLRFFVHELSVGSVCALAEHFDLFKLFHFLEHSWVLGFTLDSLHRNIFEDAVDPMRGALISESRLSGGGHGRASFTLWREHDLNLLLFRLVDIVALFVVVLRVLDEKASDVLVVLRHLIQILTLVSNLEFPFRYLVFGQVFSVAQLSFVVLECRKLFLHVNLVFLGTTEMLLCSLLDVFDDIRALVLHNDP